MIYFNVENVEMPDFNQNLVRRWIADVAASHGFVVGRLSYLFCDDEKILEVNRQFLNHDYFTDIITFDSTHRNRIAGDIVISLSTVESNAAKLSESPIREFYRVVIHGVLHLCGIDDKGPGEREVMEQHENAALALLSLE